MFGQSGRTIIDVGMTIEELIDRVKSLSAEQQTSIVQFIDYQFMKEHPELLRRLSQ